MTVDFIQSIPVFKDIPVPQIEWMLANGEVTEYKEGDILFQSGSPTDHLIIIESGEFRLSLSSNNEVRFVGELVPKMVTGVLPYSRMTHASGLAIAKEPSRILTLHRDKFPEMIREHYELTAALVHQMTDRARRFTTSQLQNEKLMSLGKLSAGLAHELNNPASAIVRSAQALQKHLQLVPESFKMVMTIDATEAQVDAVNDLLFNKIEQGEKEMSLMERTELEDDLADWLEDHGVEDGYEIAGTLVGFSFTIEELEGVTEEIPETHFAGVIKWINDNLTTDKMVGEIAEAAARIAELVKSVKGYTHMDRAKDMQKFDIHPGLTSTLTMLKHKIKQNQIEVVKDFCQELNPVMGLPGEINQVFTNIIDNALDAMEKEGGTLTIRTWNDGNFARIDIQDSGPGIPEDILGRIFDPFFTTKEMGKGTGMGLDVVNKIVTKHKGMISAKSEPGKTVFELCFPKAV